MKKILFLVAVIFLAIGFFYYLKVVKKEIGHSLTISSSSSISSSTLPFNSIESVYPLHTGIIATTFWIGEIFDSTASDGSQVISTYDSNWFTHYGGCDGKIVEGICETESRTKETSYFPHHIKPLQNPFYIDLPFDDINNEIAFHERERVIPWAHDTGFEGHSVDPNFSYMKNRWIKLIHNENICYGQIEDAGPGQYSDAKYVFDKNDLRPKNTKYNNAGMDISPALNGCLGFKELNGDRETLDWQFIEEKDVPLGPWKKIVTTSQIIL